MVWGAVNVGAVDELSAICAVSGERTDLKIVCPPIFLVLLSRFLSFGLARGLTVKIFTVAAQPATVRA